jgi:hypothetical protein
MAYKAQFNLPKSIGDLKQNFKSLKWEITRDGITYSMSIEMTRNLIKYFTVYVPGIESDAPTMEKWYGDLSKEDKARVKREGNLPTVDTGFYPDPEFE